MGSNPIVTTITHPHTIHNGSRTVHQPPQHPHLQHSRPGQLMARCPLAPAEPGRAEQEELPRRPDQVWRRCLKHVRERERESCEEKETQRLRTTTTHQSLAFLD